ncbi:MAG TPA: hypothetical protein PLV21_10990 [Cyclobacteriaceae bacterium]|nr:hypothetical protein [Cyclobacteriaceae bacterium]HRJ82404.1 hypothetical protein [Cyclobacteriaceae bacterium]
MRNILLLAFLAGTAYYTLAQGCSDAGFCTMGAMKPDQPFNKKVPLKLRSMELSLYRGTTTLSPVVYVANLDMSFNIIDNKTFFQIKLPYQAVRGNFGNTSGLGDISYCLTRNIYSSEKFDIGLTIGGKIPSNNSNLKDDKFGLPLPMYYQTSLGTYDAIAGLSLVNRKWLFATGIQHPFNKNGNQFRWGEWIPVYEGGPDYVRKNNLCYELKRGTDVMLRAERNFRFAQFNFSVGLLPIWRITKDEILNTNTNEREKLDGTLGMALSGIVTAGYSFNVKSGVRLLAGKKITQRDVNPDGLTREDVMTLSYFYRF